MLETLEIIALCSLDFLAEMGRRLSVATGDARETAFLFQRISVALQRFNAVFIHESFVVPVRLDVSTRVLASVFSALAIYTIWQNNKNNEHVDSP